jgi:hypothetical protein
MLTEPSWDFVFSRSSCRLFILPLKGSELGCRELLFIEPLKTVESGCAPAILAMTKMESKKINVTIEVIILWIYIAIRPSLTMNFQPWINHPNHLQAVLSSHRERSYAPHLNHQTEDQLLHVEPFPAATRQ